MTERMILGLAVMFMLALAISSTPSAAGNWKETFDDICSKTQGSDTLSVKELSSLIERSDKLMPEIQSSDDPSKKIYLQRLKKCKALFEFMIESKKGSEK
ncbi:MAG: hypothetical protein AABZ15_12540 [Nitrospirota bacterium]